MNKRRKSRRWGRKDGERKVRHKCQMGGDLGKTEMGNTALLPRQIVDCCLKYYVIFHQNSEIQLITFECLLQMQFIPALGIMRIELRSRRNICISLISGVFVLSYS